MKPPNTVIVHVPSYLVPGYVYPSPANLAAQQLLRAHHKTLSDACDNLEAADSMYPLTSLIRGLDTRPEAWCAQTVRMLHHLTEQKFLQMELDTLDAYEAEGANPCIVQHARIAISTLENIHAAADEFVKAHPKPKRKYTRLAPNPQPQLNI